MATSECTAAPAQVGGTFQSLFVATVARLQAIFRAIQNRRAVAKLLDWDDRMLRDIGLTSNDVRAVMAMKRTEDPSLQLSVLSVERRAALRAEGRERLALAAASMKARTPKRKLPPSRTYPVLDL